MERKEVKRPEYDGNACLLYDFMIYQHLTEKIVMQRMGIYKGDPYQPVARWIQSSGSIPYYQTPSLCAALNAPLDATYMNSRILNGKPFDALYARMASFAVYARVATDAGKFDLSEISTADLVEEIKHRGYRVYREV